MAGEGRAAERLADAVGLSGRAILALFLAALAVRLGYVLSWLGTDGAFLYDDSKLFLASVDALIDQGRFLEANSPDARPMTERMPGYILFLAGHRLLFGDGLWPVVISQSLLGAATVVLIAGIAAPLGRGVGLIAGALAVVWPNLVLSAGYILDDTLFLAFAVAAMFAGVRFFRTGDWRWCVVLGLTLGLSIAVRPIAQFLPPAILVIGPLAGRVRFGSWRKGAVAGLVAAGLATAVVAPVALHNQARHGTPALTSQGGTHAALWMMATARSYAEGESRAAIARRYSEEAVRRAPEAFAPGGDVFRQSRVLSRIALEELAAMSVGDIALAWARGAVVNLAAPAVLTEPRLRAALAGSFDGLAGQGLAARVTAFIADQPPTLAATMMLSVLGAGVVCVLHLIGFLRHARMTPDACLAASAVVLYFLLIMGPVATPKYRLPMEPMLILWTALALHLLLRRR